MMTMQQNLRWKFLLASLQSYSLYYQYLFLVWGYLGLQPTWPNNAQKKSVYARCWEHPYSRYGHYYQRILSGSLLSVALLHPPLHFISCNTGYLSMITGSVL